VRHHVALLSDAAFSTSRRRTRCSPCAWRMNATSSNATEVAKLHDWRQQGHKFTLQKCHCHSRLDLDCCSPTTVPQTRAQSSSSDIDRCSDRKHFNHILNTALASGALILRVPGVHAVIRRVPEFVMCVNVTYYSTLNQVRVKNRAGSIFVL
jgi:hypothetical protein